MLARFILCIYLGDAVTGRVLPSSSNNFDVDKEQAASQNCIYDADSDTSAVNERFQGTLVAL